MLVFLIGFNKMNKIILSIILSFAAYSMVGCGGGQVGITAQSAPAVATQFVGLLSSLPKGNVKQDMSSQEGLGSFPTTNAMVSTNALGIMSCTTSEPVPVQDLDADGIADYRKYTMNCDDVSDGVTLHNIYKGTYEIKDLDPAVDGVRGGYLYNLDIPQWSFEDGVGHSKANGYYKGFWQGKGLSDTSTEFTSNMNARINSEFDAQGHHFKLGFDFTWNYKITYTHPVTGFNSNWTSGGFNGIGEFALVGVYMINETTGETGSGGATMTWKAEDVKFEQTATCPKYYKSGRMILSDISGSILRIEFDCNNPKVYLNGQLVDGVTGW